MCQIYLGLLILLISVLSLNLVNIITFPCQWSCFSVVLYLGKYWVFVTPWRTKWIHEKIYVNHIEWICPFQFMMIPWVGLNSSVEIFHRYFRFFVGSSNSFRHAVTDIFRPWSKNHIFFLKHVRNHSSLLICTHGG